MQQQNPLTLVTPIKPERVNDLFDNLKELRNELEKDLPVRLESLGTIHYARWLVIDYDFIGNKPQANINSKLVFSSNFDGGVDEHILQLSDKARNIIDKLYDCCQGYNVEEITTTEQRADYLRQWQVPASAFYRGAPHRSLPQIKQEEALRQHVRNFLDSKNWKDQNALEIFTQVRTEVENNPSFTWAKQKPIIPSVNYFQFALLVLVLLALLPIVIVWVLVLHFRHEIRDKNFDLKRSQLDEKYMQYLQDYEDLEFQNQFSQICTLKPGFMRRVTFKFMMLFARTLIPIKFVQGKLMGIPTIHFARWVLFDNDKRVLFFSNFDGSWQQYLGDFIDKSGWGLTGIFSNTTYFPKTNFLLTGGAYDEEHFLAWSRFTELPTQIWYNAYPHLSIKNVNNNTLIRSYFSKPITEANAKAFFKLI
jgi:hypothetical protein